MGRVSNRTLTYKVLRSEKTLQQIRRQRRSSLKHAGGRLKTFNGLAILLNKSCGGTIMDAESGTMEKRRAERRSVVLRTAEERGLLGAKDRTIGGRLPAALIEQAKRVSGIEETTELLTYALARVAIEDDFGERLIARKGRVPRGTFFAG
jgi:hypothetical protein